MRYAPAQYLLRLDDLCPTMHREKWQRFERLIQELRLQPILAVIPENQDPELMCASADPEFWDRMRVLESAGAVIGLHGYRHTCASAGRSLVPLHRFSEFAGVEEATQRAWIHAGLETLRGHGLHPRIFVAPRHGFDRVTLRALRAEGIGCLSDGFAQRPFTCEGMVWIPQQRWSPVHEPQGLWTICMHSNTASDSQVDALRSFLELHAAQFTAIDPFLAMPPPAQLDWRERLDLALMLARTRLAHWRNHRSRSA